MLLQGEGPVAGPKDCHGSEGWSGTKVQLGHGGSGRLVRQHHRSLVAGAGCRRGGLKRLMTKMHSKPLDSNPMIKGRLIFFNHTTDK